MAKSPDGYRLLGVSPGDHVMLPCVDLCPKLVLFLKLADEFATNVALSVRVRRRYPMIRCAYFVAIRNN